MIGDRGSLSTRTPARVLPLVAALLALAPFGPHAPAAALAPMAAPAMRQDTLLALTGRVVDASGEPVADAEVFVSQLDRRVRTDADGRFRLAPVPAGTYDVGVRKLGFLPRGERLAALPTGVAPVTITLIAYSTRLPPVVTTGRRGGLSGVVADTALVPIPGARVSVRGSGRSVLTDSAGRFFIPLTPDSYMVQVSRKPYATQSLAVHVPRDSGREIAVWLAPLDPKRKAELMMQEVRLFELDHRMLLAKRQSTRFFTRQQLEALGITELLQLVRRWAAGPVDPGCLVTLAEGAALYPETSPSVPLGSVYTDEVEFVELTMVPRQATISFPRSDRARAIYEAQQRLLPCGYIKLHVWPRS